MTTAPFADIPGLDLSDAANTALAARGVSAPTPVQMASIPLILAGGPVVMHSGTGTGKTLAYLLPILRRLHDDPTLRAAVICPGTELAMQTLAVAREVAPDLPSAAAVSTTSRKRQRKRVQGGTRLIIGTPDRMAELFTTKKLKQVRILVLDELDPILAAQASDFLDPMLSRSEPQVQVVVASATLGGRSEAFIQRFFPDAARVRPESNPLEQAIAHHRSNVPRNQPKEIALARFLQEHKCRRAIVFVADPRLQSHLERYLVEHGVRATTVTREAGKTARQNHLDAFRSGQAHVLITTDAIARGLDVPEIDWILHFDLPRNAAAYVHRAGRTGRAGRQGTSVVFVDDEARGTLARVSRELGIDFLPMPERKRGG